MLRPQARIPPHVTASLLRARGAVGRWLWAALALPHPELLAGLRIKWPQACLAISFEHVSRKGQRLPTVFRSRCRLRLRHRHRRNLGAQVLVGSTSGGRICRRSGREWESCDGSRSTQIKKLSSASPSNRQHRCGADELSYLRDEILAAEVEQIDCHLTPDQADAASDARGAHRSTSSFAMGFCRLFPAPKPVREAAGMGKSPHSDQSKVGPCNSTRNSTPAG